MKLTALLKISTIFLWVVLLYACSDDRLKPLEKEVAIENPPVKTDDITGKKFANANSIEILSKLAEKTSKYTINSTTDLPIVTAKGTKIWVYEFNVTNSNGTQARYPYDVEIVEMFRLGDMVLHQKPTTSFGNILVTAGALYFNVSKDGKSLIANQSLPPQINVIPQLQKLDTSMRLFYGTLDRQEQFTWIAAPIDSTRNPTQQKENPPPLVFGLQQYQLFPRNFGWINCDKFLNSPLPRTSVKFTSVFPKLESIIVFMVFPDIKSVIRVWNGNSLEVPIGEKVKIVAVAQTEEKEVFSMFKDITVAKDQVVEIKVIKTEEKDFLDALQKL